jgi:hypothetical protein
LSIDKKYYVVKSGEINSPKGMNVKLFTLENTPIGETNIVSLFYGTDIDINFFNLLSGVDEKFNENDTVYQYSLKINEEFRNQGWGYKIKEECNIINKNHGIKNILNIVRHDNIPSQKLMKNLGCEILNSNDIRDLFLLKV